jgi:hypothetical protein
MSLRKWSVLVLAGMLMVFVVVPFGCKKDTQESEESEEEESGKDDDEKIGTREKLKPKKRKGSKKGDKKDKEARKSFAPPVTAADRAKPAIPGSDNLAGPEVMDSGKSALDSGPSPVGKTGLDKPAIPRDPAGDSRIKALAKVPPSTAHVIPAPPVRVPVARYLTVIDLNEYLTEKGWIAYGPVQGIPPSETFNSLIYRRPGTARFVSILVWDFEQYAQAIEKWSALLATYPNAQELTDMFVKYLFFSYRNQVISLTFLRADKAMVLSLSCHTEVCDDTALYELAKAVDGRVSR